MVERSDVRAVATPAFGTIANRESATSEDHVSGHSVPAFFTTHQLAPTIIERLGESELSPDAAEWR
jgi:hypothetical protein